MAGVLLLRQLALITGSTTIPLSIPVGVWFRREPAYQGTQGCIVLVYNIA